jgi:glutaredoxin-related protein
MRFFARVFLPCLLLIYIGIETYLKLQHTSLCGEVGCKLAGELLNFAPIYLNYFGLIGLLFLIFFGYRSLTNTFSETLFFLLLYAGIAFEATIFSYQIIVNPELCIFCLSVFSSLLVIALFSHAKYFAVILTSILFIFLGLKTLTIPENRSFVTTPGLYLIQSETCGHCIKVKKYFAEHHINYTAIPSKGINARGFLKFVEIHSIPVLIIKESDTITMIKGDKNIIAHFDAKNKKPIPQIDSNSISDQNNAIGLSRDFLSAGSDDGCTLSISETSSCKDDNTTPQ